MGLMDNQKFKIKQEYTKVWDVVEQLYKLSNNNWGEVAQFLGHHDFDTELQLYYVDDFFKIHAVCFDFEPIRNLIEKLNTLWLETDDKELNNLKFKLYGYYWSSFDLYIFEPLGNLGIVDSPSQTIESDFNFKKNSSYKDTFFKYDIFNIFEVTCLIADYNPNELTIDQTRKVNWREKHPEFVNALSLIMATDMVKAGFWQTDSNYYEGEYAIKNEDLKLYLASKNIFIDGFNNDLSINESISVPSTLSQIQQENQQLKSELAEAKERIKQLESEQRDKQSKEPNLLDLIFDDTIQERYAPDLVLSIKLWEHIYITNKKDDSHTNTAVTWLSKNTGYDTAKKQGSASKIREVTTPFINWGNLRDKNHKK